MDEKDFQLGEINFVFCNDNYLSELNVKYLKHKSLTDILTFSLDDENGCLCGDIFISVPRIKENAKKYQQALNKRMIR